MAEGVHYASATRKKQCVPAVSELPAISASPLPPPSGINSDEFIKESNTDMAGDDVATDHPWDTTARTEELEDFSELNAENEINDSFKQVQIFFALMLDLLHLKLIV